MAFLGFDLGLPKGLLDSITVLPGRSLPTMDREKLYPRPAPTTQHAYVQTPEESALAQQHLSKAMAGDTSAFVRPGHEVDPVALELIKNNITKINSKLVSAGKQPLLSAEELAALESERGAGPLLTSAIKKFQSRFGLDSNGVAHDRVVEGASAQHSGCLRVDGIAGTWTLTAMQAFMDNGVSLADMMPDTSPFAGLTRHDVLNRIQGGFWFDDIGSQFRPTFSQDEDPDNIRRSGGIARKPNPLILNRGGGTVSQDVVLGASPTPLMATLADCAWNRMLEYTRHNGVSQSSSTHQCARIPRLAFGDCDITDGEILGNGQAKNYVAALRAHPGFMEVPGVRPADLEALPPGCVVIYRNPKMSQAHAGHMEVTVASKTRDDGSLCSAVSDFGQNSRLVYKHISDLHVFVPIDKHAQFV